MEAINNIMNGLDLEKLVPDLALLTGHLHKLAVAAVLIGPVVLLVLGLVYLLFPTAEANRKFGFRTYFGMGSVEAWRFSQRLAGIVYTALGGVLTIIMIILATRMGAKVPLEQMNTAMTCLFWQLGLVAAAYLGIAITSAVFFDKNGDRRR